MRVGSGRASGRVTGVADFFDVIRILLIQAGDLIMRARRGVFQLVQLRL